jgi:ligand-binding sensor domain-containing protein
MSNRPVPHEGDTGSATAHRIILVGQVAVGVLIVAGLIWFILGMTDFVQEQTLPEGVDLIRPPTEVSALLIDADVVWTGGKDGVILVDRNSHEQLPLPPSAPPFGYVRDLCKDRHGAIWVAHDGGLARYGNGSWTAFSQRTGAPFGRALSVLEVSGDAMWVGSDERIFAWDGSVWETVAFPRDLTIASADVLYQDSTGRIWVGCGSPMKGGLYCLDDEGWHVYSLVDGLPHATVNRIIEDRAGTVWIATGFASQGGAARFSDGIWSSITQADGLAGGSTRSVYEDRDGRLWMGSEYDGIAVLSKGQWIVLTQADGLAGNEVKEMVQDVDGTCWLGTDRGLTVLSDVTSLLA